MKYKLFFIFGVLILITLALLQKEQIKSTKKLDSLDRAEISASPALESSPTLPASPATSPTKTVTPSTANIEVPFTSQAPLLNWDALHEDACEEASLIMAIHYKNGTRIINAESAEEEIQSMIKYEESIGYDKSITIDQLQKLATHYGLTSQAKSNATAAKLKAEILQHRIVIIPAYGRDLGNPHFTAPGPIYHMLVVKGFDNDEFITNDPGTKYGADYRYTFNILINAIHDWNENNVQSGAKNYLVIE